MDGREELEQRGIRPGDDTDANVANFAKEVLNNRLSTEAIHTFVSASKGSLEMVSRAVEANVGICSDVCRTKSFFRQTI